MRADTVFNRVWVVSPSDTVDYAQGLAEGFVAGTATAPNNAVAVVLQNGEAVTMTVQAGILYPIKHRRINNTNTTASTITAMQTV